VFSAARATSGFVSVEGRTRRHAEEDDEIGNDNNGRTKKTREKKTRPAMDRKLDNVCTRTE